MKTSFLLLAQYGGRTVIPLDLIARDFFGGQSPAKLQRKITTGEIALPLFRSERSQKGERGVHLADLAAYIDKQREEALKEMTQLQGTKR